VSVAKKVHPMHSPSRSAPTFDDLFDRRPEQRASAHGRVNLIGEHTDYNEGFVLPTPIPQRTDVELAPRNDRKVRAFSVEFSTDGAREDIVEYDLGREAKRGSWIDYVQGTTHVLWTAGYEFSGFDVRIDSDVPVGGGLSSSAALEVSLLRALKDAFALRMDPLELARFGRRVETDFIGAPIGIMDQMSASVGVYGQALFIDTRSLDYVRIPLPKTFDLAVIDSGVAHAHGAGEYGIRRRECEEAAKALGVETLRDVDLIAIERARNLHPPLDRRARHVVSENERVLEAVQALRASDLVRLGALFNASHASMRDDFEISTDEIDMLVELAREQSDVFGARLTGGGFGGSIVVLTREGRGRAIAEHVAAAYRVRSGKESRILVPPPEGAH
jgi:galactokinase